MTTPIAILGAGPSGLALGRLLEVSNIDYTIFERDESAVLAAGRGGGTLDVHTGSGQAALQEAGLLEQFKSIARYDATNTLTDSTGKICLEMGDDGEQDRPEIDRKDLRDLLLNSVPAAKVRWAKKVQCVQKENDGSMSVHFTDGTIESGFQLVVGADGAWSNVRSMLTSTTPQYSGMSCFTATIRPDNRLHSSAAALAGKGNYMSFGARRQFAVQMLGDGSYYLTLGMHLPESWISENATIVKDPTALRQLLLRDYFDASPQVHKDLIQHSDGDLRLWPLYALPAEAMAWQTVPGVTLIGDAAHLSTPFVGEGVNCAMYDSLQLSQQIVKHGLGGLGHAVEEYEKLMFPRAIDLITRSATSAEYLFAPDAPWGWIKSFAGIDSA